MKKALFVLLAILLLLSLCACDSANMVENPTDTTGVPAEKIQGQLTWDAIQAFPIKYPDMPIQERRQLCVDFFNFSKTALWTPKEDMTFYVSGSDSQTYTLKKGALYGGLPYMTVSSGNVYRLMDFMNEATGEVDTAKYMAEGPDESGAYSNQAMKLFGGQCSYNSYWAWARVVNSANYGLTYHGLPKRDFILVGEYPGCGLEELEIWLPTTRDEEDKIDNTVEVCQELGSQQMYENYAKMHLGDGMVYVTSGGHFIMCASEPHVEYFDDDTVNGAASYVHITDQGSRWTDNVNDYGELFLHVGNVNTKVTFQYLYEHHYVPFTYQEFQEGDILEDTEVSFSHTGSEITKAELFTTKVTANYGISDIHVIVSDDSGKEVYRHIVRAEAPNKKEMTILEKIYEDEDGDKLEVVDTLGTLSSGTYQIKIEVQLGTGERPTVYTGTLKV